MDRQQDLGSRLTPRVAIIGAGWAGLACAVELTLGGAKATVFEASRTLGGRARELVADDPARDNGQHILLGAYRDTLAIMRAVGVAPESVLLRWPLQFHFPGQLRLRAPDLPAPLGPMIGFLLARGFSIAEKWAGLRLITRLQAPLPDSITVAELFAMTRQPSRVVRLVWEPLCVGALNTPIELACARVFARVVRDALGGPAASGFRASDMLLPRVPLSRLFPEPAARWLESNGGQLRRGVRIREVSREGAGWRVGDALFDQVVIATAPFHVADLLPVGACEQTRERLAQFSWQPITTCYLQYAEALTLPSPMLGLESGLAQWLFDRGALCGERGSIAAVISARGEHSSLSREAIAEKIEAEVATILGRRPLLLEAQVITEKRATFSATPQALRPDIKSGAPGLWLAGDYLDAEYPATLETAVKCARRVAREILNPAAAPNPASRLR